MQQHVGESPTLLYLPGLSRFHRETNNAGISRVSEGYAAFFCPKLEKEIFDYEDRKGSSNNKQKNKWR